MGSRNVVNFYNLAKLATFKLSSFLTQRQQRREKASRHLYKLSIIQTFFSSSLTLFQNKLDSFSRETSLCQVCCFWVRPCITCVENLTVTYPKFRSRFRTAYKTARTKHSNLFCLGVFRFSPVTTRESFMKSARGWRRSREDWSRRPKSSPPPSQKKILKSLRVETAPRRFVYSTLRQPKKCFQWKERSRGVGGNQTI
jgi:hypothetical protein